MTGFSQRHGFTKPPEVFEINDMSRPVRLAVWNLLNEKLFSLYVSHSTSNYERQSVSAKMRAAFKHLWVVRYGNDYDSLQPMNGGLYDWAKSKFLSVQWYEAFDLLEFLIEEFSPHWHGLSSGVNDCLARVYSGYRIVDGLVTPMTDQLEIDAVSECMAKASDLTKEHLQKALRFLGDHPAPDYSNSIRESISAVEQVCRTISGVATLGDALKKISLPGTLKAAFEKLYAWTNGPQGIRHALMEEPKLTHAEAKFMLVTCTTFISYLREKTI